MRYRNTAIQIYDMPMSTNSEVRWNRRMAMLVSVIGLLALTAVVGFVVFGIYSQRL